MSNGERRYFRRRALQEIEAAMRANSIEAELSHSGLAQLHLQNCVGCVERRTRECLDCPMWRVCDLALAARHMAQEGESKIPTADPVAYRQSFTADGSNARQMLLSH
ncbi:hypothetical protein OF829_02185 [Sphingomonas sp. LB-2]|uniref:hypothetical protein n=1 Tax=Sphingomonas caeni TaxID=2984949 RepID=UPI00222F2A04|nr:hypothetical protein [Sphingomonas caeni]MCW3846030.1 hypothetical protein [Sphingomonas caeni]